MLLSDPRREGRLPEEPRFDVERQVAESTHGSERGLAVG